LLHFPHQSVRAARGSSGTGWWGDRTLRNAQGLEPSMPDPEERMSTRCRTALLTLLLAPVAALAACDSEPSVVAPEGALFSQHAAGGSAELNHSLAQLRALTAPFHRIEAAKDAGWNLQLSPCVELPGVGGMGYHYGNPEYLDGTVNLLEPEALLYEPMRNGKKRLVAVEYVVPYDFLPRDAEPPTLLGQDFHQLDGPGVWGLHVWIWHHNPAGMFADWNPRVSCEHDQEPGGKASAEGGVR
jgi:hypothetical protein